MHCTPREHSTCGLWNMYGKQDMSVCFSNLADSFKAVGADNAPVRSAGRSCPVLFVKKRRKEENAGGGAFRVLRACNAVFFHFFVHSRTRNTQDAGAAGDIPMLFFKGHQQGLAFAALDNTVQFTVAHVRPA